MLIIAEKPSLAKAIASGIADNVGQMDGCYRAGPHIVTWCFGHVLEQAPPQAYDPAYQKWNLESLPIRVPADKWILLPKKDAQQQIRIIASLVAQAETVVNAGDPDREGQMLVDELLEYLKWQGKTMRLMLNDTTPASVKRAFGAMEPNAKYRPLYEAALCRSRADWLVGMNLTRAATLRVGPMISVGRVQTPTLALVVRRDRTIEGHKQRFFYTLHATCNTAQDTVVLSHEPEEEQRIYEKKDADAIAAALIGQNVTLQVQEVKQVERSPLPFMLSTFQKAAEDAFGWSAATSLEVLQELYEKQLVSYPRTDCAYLPREQAGAAKPMADAILAAGHFPEARPIQPTLQPKERVYDDAKVAEHHGLTPTRRLPGEDLPTKLRQGWELVARQFLASLAPDYEALAKTVAFKFEGREFRAKGETPLNLEASWRMLIPKSEPPKALALRAGHGEQLPARVRDVEVKQGKTTPPKPYTEASLIADMRAVAKFVTDERLKAILKETAGIGTAATQANIIGLLKDRGYIEPAGKGKVKAIRSTPLGRYVIDALPPNLSDPGITALWEDQLTKIAGGQASAAEFMVRIEGYVTRYTDALKTQDMPPLPPEAVQKKPAAAPESRAKARAGQKKVLGKKRRYS